MRIPFHGYRSIKAHYVVAALALLIGFLLLAHTASRNPHGGSTTELPNLPNLSVEDAAASQHYGITAAFLRSIDSAGFGPASPKQLVALRQYGVDGQYATRMKAAGMNGLNWDELVRLHQYEISPEYAASMSALGYKTPESLIRLRQYGATSAQIDKLQQTFHRRLSVDEVIRLAQVGFK
jgi:hypothetical protein